MDINTVLLLRAMSRLLMQYLELADKIPESDFREVVLTVQKHKRDIKAVMDNVDRGNLFLTIFFLRELLEKTIYDEKLK